MPWSVAYLNQLGLPTSAVIYITEPPLGEIRWLTVADAKKYGIEVKVVNLTPVKKDIQGNPAPKNASQSQTKENVVRSFMSAYFENSCRENNFAAGYYIRAYANQVNFDGKILDSTSVIKDKLSMPRPTDSS